MSLINGTSAVLHLAAGLVVIATAIYVYARVLGAWPHISVGGVIALVLFAAAGLIGVIAVVASGLRLRLAFAARPRQ